MNLATHEMPRHVLYFPHFAVNADFYQQIKHTCFELDLVSLSSAQLSKCYKALPAITNNVLALQKILRLRDPFAMSPRSASKLH